MYPFSPNPNPGGPGVKNPTTPQPQPQIDALKLLTCEHAPNDSAHACQEVREGPGGGAAGSAGTPTSTGPGPSLPRPSPVLLRQLHHHGRELIEHEDSGKPLITHQPIGDLLMSGHRELICPQHLGWKWGLGQGQLYDTASNPTPAPRPLLSAVP